MTSTNRETDRHADIARDKRRRETKRDIKDRKGGGRSRMKGVCVFVEGVGVGR